VDEPDYVKSNRWLTTILVNTEKSGGITREGVRLKLESRPLWKSMHKQLVFKMPRIMAIVSQNLFLRMDYVCIQERI